MQIQWSQDAEAALTLTLTQAEVPLFRAALERANFMDTPPELQGQVLDFLEQLLVQVPENEF